MYRPRIGPPVIGVRLAWVPFHHCLRRGRARLDNDMREGQLSWPCPMSGSQLHYVGVRLLEGVLHLFARLLQVAGGLVHHALGFQVTVVRCPPGSFLDAALRGLRGVLHLVGGTQCVLPSSALSFSVPTVVPRARRSMQSSATRSWTVGSASPHHRRARGTIGGAAAPLPCGGRLQAPSKGRWP